MKRGTHATDVSGLLASSTLPPDAAETPPPPAPAPAPPLLGTLLLLGVLALYWLYNRVIGVDKMSFG